MDPHDNNLIALGLDDGTIAVYNVRQDSVQWASKKTHKAAVTGVSPAACELCTLLSGCQVQARRG